MNAATQREAGKLTANHANHANGEMEGRTIAGTVADTGASVHAPLCEACGRATEELNAAVSAKHFFLSVTEMFDAGQIKAFTLTPQDSKKLKLLIEAATKH